MRHQHRYMLHGLTTDEQARAVQETLSQQAGMLEVSVTADPPEAVVLVDAHPSVADIQRIVSQVGAFHVMEAQHPTDPIGMGLASHSVSPPKTGDKGDKEAPPNQQQSVQIGRAHV